MNWRPWWEGVDKAMTVACLFLLIPFLMGMGIATFLILTKPAEILKAEPTPKKVKTQPKFGTSYGDWGTDTTLLSENKSTHIDCGWEKC